MTFQVVEVALREIFLPDLFQGAPAQIPGREITSLPIKQSGINLPDPTRTVGVNCTVSWVITGHLFLALRRTAEFRLVDHALLVE